ncbi:MAG: hypothetical protein MZV65_14825 [Chromatiales bacterium]|nr:hypothetical protein [Chromatiales bacterium]
MPTTSTSALIAFLRFRPDLLFDFDPAHESGGVSRARARGNSPIARWHKFGDRSDLLLPAPAGLRRPVRPDIELKAFVDQPGQPAGHRRDPARRGRAGAEGHRPAVRRRRGAGAGGRSAPAATATPTRSSATFSTTPRRFPQREMGVMLVSDMHRAIGRRPVRGAAVRAVGQVDRRRDVV